MEHAKSAAANDDFADVFDPHLPESTTLAGLADMAVWLNWREDSVKGELRKVPYSPSGTGKASATDPRTWGTLHRAERRARTLLKGRQAGGIGIVLGKLPDGRCLGGLDLDTCRDPETGQFDPWARALFARWGTYAEVSPSRTGTKLYFSYDDDPRLWKALDGKRGRSFKRGTGKHPPAIELFLAERYFAVTRDRVPGCPEELAHISTEALLRLIEHDGPEFAGRKADKPARDDSRSGRAFRLAAAIKSSGGTEDDFREALADDAELSEWADDERQVARAWDRAPQFSTTAKGALHSNVANALSMLRAVPELAGLLRYDEMGCTPVLTRPVPAFGEAGGSDFAEPRPIADADVVRVQEWLQRAGLTSLSRDAAHSAVDAVAMENRFHPVRDYLTALEWDDVPRLDKWLHRYLGAADTLYSSAVGRMWLLGMCARIRKPGCKVDYMPILEGGQGAAKSTALGILAGRWFSDHLPELGAGKDVSQHLRDKWLIEVPELQATRKAEAPLLKAFVTRQVEKYRPSYGRREVVEPRQCVFVGTTNEARYLKDSTGNRRFWPVTVGDMLDTQGLARDRDQLLAEAWEALGWGEHWWPDREFEAHHMRPEQDKRRETDPWLEPVREAIKGLERVTVKEVAEEIGIHMSALDRQKEMRIADCLKDSGWKLRHLRTGNAWERGQ